MDTTHTPQPVANYDRITVSLPSVLAAYVRGQAARELRSASGMLAYMAEQYRVEKAREDEWRA